ncbi:hypothetical protein [Pseudonocardia sp. WMMC193]|uniref:hypothetical protein n=1 Tax=Pseudonocardia sp. WMMC193 TaxID=2911965 RepID=UPI001F379824|nr:hypothetical protein [Pseudonocardia sp. WMMC193]MCF7550600.1 hypothetical protein [Pseudonocardia sp. WMMC193]
MTTFARALGVATAAYAVATLVRPSVLTGPTGLGDSAPAQVLTRAVGARDLASGVAVATAPTGRALELALGVRIGADLGDAVAFGLSDIPADAKKKTLAVSLGWAALNGVALALLRR